MHENRKYRYKVREFLNVDEDLRAYIIANVRESEKNDTYTNIQLEIADCSRQINLDFDFSNKLESIEKIEKKINLFRQIMNDFADAVDAEIAAMKVKSSKKKRGRPRKIATEATLTTSTTETIIVEV